MGGTGSESALSTPLRFTPSCAKSPDEETEYLRTLAKVITRGRGRVARPHSPVLPGPSATTQMTSSVV
jgi:hypothetical protein